MTYSEVESKVANLAVIENIYILIARNLEQKAADLRQQAARYREHAHQLNEKQQCLWKELA